MRKRTETATMAHTPVMVNMKPLQICASGVEGSYVAHPAAAPGSGDDQQTRKAVEKEGQEEEHQAKLDQGLRMELAGGFGEFIGDDGGNGISGRKERSADDGRIADDHGDGHRFAERSGKGQENGTKNARAGKRNDNFPRGFPARGPERECSFALVTRDGEKHFTGDGNDIGDDHDGEDDARGQEADAVGGALKKREEAERVLESRLNVLTHQRNDDEDAEHAVDDAGDGGEKIDEKFERVRNSRRGQLSKKNGGADAEGHGDQQSYGGGDERAVNERQSAELFEDGIPDRGEEKIEAKLVR